ncbi:MAG: hypothetical protein Q4Q19_09380 [Methanobrevibacter sp.]|nr:hypothetical protein [Methanobrevibacter sp.]
MKEKQTVIDYLTKVISCIVIIAFCAMLFLFVQGQISANKAIVSAGNAVMSAARSGTDEGEPAIDYSEAIEYINIAQQAYSENSMLKIATLVYTLSTTIIIGYGAKILRLGEAEKRELCQEVLQKAKKQFSEDASKMLQHHSNVSFIITSCGNVAHICFLLRSNIELLENESHGPISPTQFIERLQIELMNTLKEIEDFLFYLQDADEELTKAQFDVVKIAWFQALKSIDQYVLPAARSAEVSSVFDSKIPAGSEKRRLPLIFKRKSKNEPAEQMETPKPAAASCLERVFGKYNLIAAEEAIKKIKSCIKEIDKKM